MIASIGDLVNDLVDWGRDHGAFVAWAAGILTLAIPLASAAISRRRAERRARYAVMGATLAAWCELPFRIRRRTSNSQVSLDKLTGHIHDLQQQFVLDCVDLRTECGWLADVRDQIQSIVQQQTKPWITEAWTTAPISTTAGMNLNGWGPAGLNKHIEQFALEARWRFGWRRALNPLRRAYKSLQHQEGR